MTTLRLTLTILLLAEGHVLDDCDVPGTSLIQRSLSISRIPKWYGKGGNRKHDGFSNVKAPSHLSQGPSWSWIAPRNGANASGLVRASPIIDDDGSIYIASADGDVLKFDKHGEVLWKYKADDPVPSNPVLDDGHLFICTEKCNFVALDPKDGHVKWQKRAGFGHGSDTSSVISAKDMVMAACYDEGEKGEFGGSTYVVALSNHGHEKWKFRPAHPVYNFLGSVVSDSLYFADAMGGAYSLKLDDGKEVWKHPAPANARMSTGGMTGGSYGVLYVTHNLKEPSGNTGALTAFDLDGKKLWEKHLPMSANSGAAIGQRGKQRFVVVAVGPNPALAVAPDISIDLEPLNDNAPMKEKVNPRKPAKAYALDADTGEQIWSFDFPDWFGATAGDVDGHICLPDSFANPSIGGDGAAYIGHESGRLYRLLDEDEDGKITGHDVESFDFKNGFQGAPALSDGILAVSPCNGMHVFLS